MDVRKPLHSNPRKHAATQSSPESERLVISWFGWDIAHFELISEETFQSWVDRLCEHCDARGWTIERLGNPIDLIFGCPSRSITRKEFFQFQKDWDALNREFAFRFSGFLFLMNATGGYDKDLPREMYSLGSIRRGDSIGRPSRHDRRKSLESGGTR